MGTSGHCQRASWMGILGPSVGEESRHVLQGCPQAAGATAWHSGQEEDASCKPPPPPTAARDWKPKQTTQQAPPCMFWQQYHSRLPGLTSPKPGTPRDEGCFCINKTFRGKRKKNQIYFLLEEEKKPSHLRVLWVWWSCQTTSKLSPGLTSPEIPDPSGAEVQVGPTLGGTE